LESYVQRIAVRPSFDMRLLDEIVFIHVVTHRPHYAARRRFRPRLRTKLDCPLFAARVFDEDLLRRARSRSTNKGVRGRSVGRAFRTAGAVEQIELLDSTRLLPKRRVTFQRRHAIRFAVAVSSLFLLVLS